MYLGARLARQDVSDVFEAFVACAKEAGTAEGNDYAETYGPDGGSWKDP